MGDGYLWITNSRTIRLLESLEEARDSILKAFEYGKLVTGEDVAAASAVLRNLRSVKEAVEDIAKEEDNNERDASSEDSIN